MQAHRHMKARMPSSTNLAEACPEHIPDDRHVSACRRRSLSGGVSISSGRRPPLEAPHARTLSQPQSLQRQVRSCSAYPLSSFKHLRFGCLDHCLVLEMNGEVLRLTIDKGHGSPQTFPVMSTF